MGEEVERGAGFEKTREGVGVWWCVGFEHGCVGEKDVLVCALG